MSIFVQPATFAVSRTVLSGGGMVAAGLNRPAKIILTLLDRFGNNLLLSDDESMSIARRVLLVCTSIEAVPFIQISGATTMVVVIVACNLLTISIPLLVFLESTIAAFSLYYRPRQDNLSKDI